MKRALGVLFALLVLPTPAMACSDSPLRGEALRWTSASALQALLAPTGTVVRFDPATAMQSPGRVTWAASDPVAVLAGERVFSLHPSGRTQPGCVPGRWTVREGPVAGRPRATLSWAPNEYAGPLALAPAGRLAFVATSPVLSGESELLILDLVRRRVGGRVAGSQGAWWSDSEIVSVDDTGTIVTLHEHRGDRWTSAVVYRASEPGVTVRLIPEASNRVVLFERSSAHRLLVAERGASGLRWDAIPTRLRHAPTEISLTAGIAVDLDTRAITVSAIGSGEPVARVEGADFYSLAALSPDGRRLAVIAHALPEDDERPAREGEATLHVFELGTTNHWVWGRAPRSTLVQHAAPSAPADR